MRAAAMSVQVVEGGRGAAPVEVVGGGAALAGVALTTDRAALIGLVAVVPLSRAVRTVTDGGSGPALVPVLQQTGLGELLYAVGIFAGLLAAR